MPRLFEKGNRDRDAELLREPREAGDRGMRVGGLRPREELVLLFRAEVRAFEELGREDDGGAPLRRLAHESLDLRDVRVERARKRALHSRKGDVLDRPGRAHAGC